MKRSIPPRHLLATILWSMFIVLAITIPAHAQDYKFTIATSQPWTDTGVDLQAGSLVAITAAATQASGASSCDPVGVASAGNASNLPLPSAPSGALIARLQENGPPTLVGASQQLHVSQA